MTKISSYNLSQQSFPKLSQTLSQLRYRKMHLLSIGILLFFSEFLMAKPADFTDLKILLSPVETLTADFQQELLNEKGNPLQQTKGQMWLKKPGQFRWEVKGKEARLVVSNGKQVWDYDKDLEQVTVQKISKTDAKAPIFFLTGDVNSLEKDFKIKNFTAANKSCMKASEQCFELQPKMEQSPFQSIRIGFKNKVLSELEMTDQLGQISFFQFSNAKLNSAISPNLFQFVAPRGVDVVGN